MIKRTPIVDKDDQQLYLDEGCAGTWISVAQMGRTGSAFSKDKHAFVEKLGPLVYYWYDAYSRYGPTSKDANWDSHGPSEAGRTSANRSKRYWSWLDRIWRVLKPMKERESDSYDALLEVYRRHLADVM